MTKVFLKKKNNGQFCFVSSLKIQKLKEINITNSPSKAFIYQPSSEIRITNDLTILPNGRIVHKIDVMKKEH